jgi:hypothetical protein
MRRPDWHCAHSQTKTTRTRTRRFAWRPPFISNSSKSSRAMRGGFRLGGLGPSRRLQQLPWAAPRARSSIPRTGRGPFQGVVIAEPHHRVQVHELRRWARRPQTEAVSVPSHLPHMRSAQTSRGAVVPRCHSQSLFRGVNDNHSL